MEEILNDGKEKKEEALEQFLSDRTNTKKEQPVVQRTFSQKGPVVAELDFLSIDLNLLPAGIFYKPGTEIRIRAASVSEVQSYSIVDDRNYLDVTEKMNHILTSCVRIKHPDGTIGSYKEIKDNDRLYLIFMIRELTFQKNTNLAKDVTCDNCSNDFKIQFRGTDTQVAPRTFVNYEMPEELADFFDEYDRCFVFEINEKVWRLAPPSIGIQEVFFKDIKDKVQADRQPNVAFLKIIPFILWDRSSITEAGIKEWEKRFKEMDMEEFLFLNQAVDRMVFGIKELKTECPSCGMEVRSDMSFPEGASSIFSIPDVFGKFAKKRV